MPTATAGRSRPAKPADAASLKAWAAGLLEAAGVESPAREASLLLAHAAGRSLAWSWTAGAADQVPEDVRAAFRAMVGRRARRLPFAYVVGTAEFVGVPLAVGPAVLVPRPETETLWETAVAMVREAAGAAAPCRLVDLGTGSGALAIALARALPEAEIWAVDASPDALAVARENVRAAGVGERVKVVRGDWWDVSPPGVPERFDGAVCNPPYLSEREWLSAPPEVRAEPRAALVAGATGLEAFEAIVAAAPGHLKPGGFLAFEVGVGQAPAVRERMRAAGFAALRVARDLAGIERVVAGTWMGRS